MANDANPTLSARTGPSPEALMLAAVARARQAAPFLPAIASLAFAIGAGYAGARLGWAAYDLASPPPPAPPPMVAAPQTPGVDPAAAAERLAALEPFGAADPAALQTSDAPDTRLDLKLSGVIAAGDPRFSRAFIVTGNGEEKGYGIGSAVPGGASVHSVHPDRVVLSRGGALETLRLPRDHEGGAVGDAAPVTATEVRSAQASPSRLLEWMRPVAATESNTGRQLGYRVYPGRDPDRFTKLGLMPGDLVTAVNGQPLDDPARSMELMRSLTASDSITLTIERDGAQRLVQIPVLQ